MLHQIDFKFADGFKTVTFVETNYLNTDIWKFESSQKESRTLSADSSKAYSKLDSFLLLLIVIQYIFV